MKYFHSILILLCAGIVSCDKNPQHPGASSVRSNDRVSVNYSTDILSGNKQEIERALKNGPYNYVIANDTPSLKNGPDGYYSHLGAAREFEHICGFTIPTWVQPVGGRYSILVTGGKPVCQAAIEYKIDPSRVIELADLVRKNHPGQGYMDATFIQPDLRGPRVITGSFRVSMTAPYVSQLSVSISDNGDIRISNTRGPEGWDQ